MSDFKAHTPGPWHVDFGEATRIKRQDGGTVATACYVSNWVRMDAGEVEANARLIAAAPELLEALEELVEVVETDTIWAPILVGRAEEAIAKARGESG